MGEWWIAVAVVDAKRQQQEEEAEKIENKNKQINDIGILLLLRCHSILLNRYRDDLTQSDTNKSFERSAT